VVNHREKALFRIGYPLEKGEVLIAFTALIERLARLLADPQKQTFRADVGTNAAFGFLVPVQVKAASLGKKYISE